MNSDALFRNYYRPLCIYALHYLLDVEQVEDVVQDCFVRLLEIGDEPQNARGWLYTAVRNRCIDQLRRKNPLLTAADQYPARGPGRTHQRRRGTGAFLP